MKFNKCERCGCFFASEDSIYLANNDMPKNADTLAFYSGVSIKNINRFLKTKEFSSLKKSFEKQSEDDPSPKVQL